MDCVPDEAGVPIPLGVEVTGPVTQAQKEALQTLITQDLGVGPEGQQYISEEAA